MKWISLTKLEQLQEMNSRSMKNKCIAVFKHSTRCSISTAAKNRIEAAWELNANELPVYYLDLLSHRDISNKIADMYEIEHESPQLLIIKNGQCIYNASHNAIRPSDVKSIVLA